MGDPKLNLPPTSTRLKLHCVLQETAFLIATQTALIAYLETGSQRKRLSQEWLLVRWHHGKWMAIKNLSYYYMMVWQGTKCLMFLNFVFRLNYTREDFLILCAQHLIPMISWHQERSRGDPWNPPSPSIHHSIVQRLHPNQIPKRTLKKIYWCDTQSSLNPFYHKNNFWWRY